MPINTIDLLSIIHKALGSDAKINVSHGEQANISIEINQDDNTNSIIDTTARPRPLMLARNTGYCAPMPCNLNSTFSIEDAKTTFVVRWDDSWTKAFHKSHEQKQAHKTFSQEFEAIIGKEACLNILGLEDFSTAINFWDNLLEFTATNMWISRKTSQRQGFFGVLANYYAISSQNGLIEWRKCNTNGYGFIDLLCHAYTLDRWDSRATLGHGLGMNFTNLFTFSSSAYRREQRNAWPDGYIIPNVMSPARPGAQITELIDRRDVLDSSNQVIGALAHYKLDNNHFCVPVAVGQESIGLGKYKSDALFLNQHLIDRNNGAAIILFQDPRVAMAVQKRLDELRGYNPNEFVITAHVGKELNMLPWRKFSCHPMVYVPAPTSASFVSFLKYETYAKSFEVSYCKLASRLFLREHPDSADLRQSSLQNVEETKLLREAVVVEECKDIIATIRCVIASAQDSTSAKRRLADLGFIKNGNDAQIQANKSLPNTLPEPEKRLLPEAPNSVENVVLYHTFKPGNYVLIVGPKDSGKTQLGLGLTRQLLVGDQVWPFGPVVSPINENVCYIDGETLQDEYKPNLRQHGLDQLLNRRLFFLSKYGVPQQEFCDDVSLRNEKFRFGSVNFMVKNKCRFAIVDNLVSLTDNNPDGCCSDVLSWIESLQRAGICVCLLHHARLQDDAQARSNENYVNKARVRIDLIHKEKLIDMHCLQNDLSHLAKSPMLSVGITYKYHKAAPALVGNTFIVSLPFGSGHWKFRGALDVYDKPMDLPWSKYVASQNNAVGNESDSTAVDNHATSQASGSSWTAHEPKTPSPDERKLLEALREFEDTATRNQLQEKCGWKDQKTLKILKKLSEKGHIKTEGSGKDRYYSLLP